MSETNLRIILLTHGADEEIINALAAIESVTLTGIFVETETVRYYNWREKIRRSIRYYGYFGTLAKFWRKLTSLGKRQERDEAALKKNLSRFSEVAQGRGVPIHYLANYHSEDSLALMRKANADLGIIYGTNILKESVYKIPRLGSINLHQGRVPYYRGGPPVFWELFNDETEVGVTVHFVEPKVDTGEVIIQKTFPLIYDYSYGLDYESFIADFRAKLMKRCPALMAEAVRQIAEGTVKPWRQNIELGRRYRLPIKKEKDEMKRRLKKRLSIASTVMVTQRLEQRGD